MGTMKEKRAEILSAIQNELARAYSKHGSDQWGRHEFYAIAKEEFDETWEAIKKDLPQDQLEKEITQVAAMCIRYLETRDRYREPAAASGMDYKAITERLFAAWEDSIRKWRLNHDSVPTCFASLASEIDNVAILIKDNQPKKSDTYTVQLKYFKPTGKYYSYAEWSVSSKLQMFEIFGLIQRMANTKFLPGLSTGGESMGYVHVECPDHPSNHPGLILIKG